jgi:hypothetical protein
MAIAKYGQPVRVEFIRSQGASVQLASYDQPLIGVVRRLGIAEWNLRKLSLPSLSAACVIDRSRQGLPCFVECFLRKYAVLDCFLVDQILMAGWGTAPRPAIFGRMLFESRYECLRLAKPTSALLYAGSGINLRCEHKA